MDYFASTSLSKLKKMIDAEKDATIKQKLLVVWHKKKGETEKGIEEMLLVPKSTVGYLVRKFRKKGIKGFKRKRKPGSGGHNRYLTNEQEQKFKDMLASRPMATKDSCAYKRELWEAISSELCTPALKKIGTIPNNTKEKTL